jgi:serralysin
MPRVLRLTNGNDTFVQGLNANNVGIEIIALRGNDSISLNRSDDLGGRNIVDAGRGNDTVQSFREDGSFINLGVGNDVYVGRGFGSFSIERADTIIGGEGQDTMAFETFKSEYYGGAGRDTFFSVGWQNTIDGGAGIDTVSYEPRVDNSTLGASAVTINLATQIVNTGTFRQEFLNSIENAIGSARDDVIIGSSGANKLTGGGGLDALTGGGGADHFVYVKTSDASVFSDFAENITDFSRTQGDKFDLTQIDARTGVNGNQAFRFIGSAEFSNVKGQLRFEQNAPNQMLVQGDVNGDGRADFQFLVDGLSSMIRDDFVL